MTDNSALPLTFWNFDDTTEWLTPLDAYCARNIVAQFARTTGRCSILEIGVWKAAWTAQVLRDVATSTEIGIDPYPNAPEVRERALRALSADGVANRFKLVSSHSQALDELALSGKAGWDVAHIDGLHTEAAVIQDLEFAHSHLSDSGVLIVDDYRHLHFPGIASAMYSFLAKSDMAIFLVTDAKAYLSRKSSHDSWKTLISDALNLADIRHWNYFGEGTAHRYVQSPEVNGSPLVIAYDPKSRAKLLQPFRDHAPPRVKQRLRRSLTDWVPPIIYRGIQRRRSK